MAIKLTIEGDTLEELKANLLTTCTELGIVETGESGGEAETGGEDAGEEDVDALLAGGEDDDAAKKLREEVKKVVVALSKKAKGPDALRALLKKFKVAKFNDIADDKMADFKKAVIPVFKATK